MMAMANLLILVPIIMMINIKTVLSGFSSMQCYTDASYQNDWDEKHNNLQYDKFLSGMYSYHSNSREDRKFKWKYCEPYSHPQISGVSALSKTSYDDQWERRCSGRNGGNSALVGATSWHSNYREDRQWKFYCGNVDNKYYLNNAYCSWTNYVNNWDQAVNYNCPSNGIIRTISSYHHNGHEDRRWRFECCRVSDKQEGVPIPDSSPENPAPYVDPELPQDYIPSTPSFPYNYLSSSSYSSWFIYIIFVLLLINCICLTYYNCIKSNKKKYKVVSMHSDSEREELNI